MESDRAFAAALAHHKARRFAEAGRGYRAILAIEPAHAASLYRLGVLTLQSGGDAETALDLMRRAIVHASPDQAAEFHRGLAFARQRQGDLAGAAEHYRLSLAADPGFADAHLNLGGVLAELGRPGEAIEALRRALALQPTMPQARRLLPILLNQLGYFSEAERCCRDGLAAAPDDPGLANTLGVACKEQYRFDEAGDWFERALTLAPDYVEALYNLGAVRKDQGRTDEAVALFRRVRALAPGLAVARIALCMAHLPPLYRDAAEIARRRQDYAEALQALADDPGDLAALAEGVGASQPFYLAYQGEDDVALQRLYGDLVCRAMAARFPPTALAARPAPGERVRVGFVSGFFRRHANWTMPIRGWLEGLDPERFALFGYHTGALRDAATDKARRLCERFVQGPLPVQRWREVIAADAPHVLIYPEVGMDPAAAQLAAMRLAPVQCNAWGHPTTSGFSTLDYYLSSDLMEPADGQDHYTETLVRLPGLSVLLSPPSPQRPADAMREAGRPVFWCGQSLYKYHPRDDALFPAIAAAAGDCRFQFIAFPGSPDLTARFRARLDAAFAEFGLDAGDYCEILPRLTPDRYAAAMARADVVLDSPGWSGCNSLVDALAFDLPIVTLPGRFMRGRHGTAILQRIGEPRTITRDAQDFVAIAARLARDAEFRAEIGRSMAAGKGRVFGDRDGVVALEAFLLGAARAIPG